MDSNKTTLANPPEWFQLEFYNFMATLDAYGWATELSYRLRTYDYDPTLRREPEGLMTGGLKHNFRKTLPIKEIETPPLPKIERSNLNDLMKWATDVQQKVRSGRLLLVNLDAPDGVISDALHAWLDNVRKQHPAPIKRRGRKCAPHLKFTEHQFATWTTKRILPLFDLEFWARLEGIKLSNLQLAEWIFPDQYHRVNNPAQLISESRRTLDKAFSLLTSLEIQVAIERG